jgi:hypothetical protein
VAKGHTRSGRAAGQADAHSSPASNPAGNPPPAPGSSHFRPLRESAPDRVALLVGAAVLVAIALAAWLALFRR